MELDKPWGKKTWMETHFPCVGASPRCDGSVSGSSLVSDKVKAPLTKIALEQLCPAFQKSLVCLQCFLLLSELQENFRSPSQPESSSRSTGSCSGEQQGPRLHPQNPGMLLEGPELFFPLRTGGHTPWKVHPGRCSCSLSPLEAPSQCQAEIPCFGGDINSTWVTAGHISISLPAPSPCPCACSPCKCSHRWAQKVLPGGTRECLPSTMSHLPPAALDPFLFHGSVELQGWEKGSKIIKSNY